MKQAHIQASLVALFIIAPLLTAVDAQPARAPSGPPVWSITEEFNTTLTRDTIETTADWNASSGTVQLQRELERSTGAEGAYDPPASGTLTGVVHNFTTVNIRAGVTITVTGTSPLVILATGNVTIAGMLRANGTNGGSARSYTAGTASGGTAGAGGYAGGSGGPYGGGAGSDGRGPCPGKGGGQGTAGGGGGGGGYGTIGKDGAAGTYNAAIGRGGGVCGDAALANFTGGSGGGGGGYGTLINSGGAGGGGGGGAIKIVSLAGITVSGTVQANGGNGGFLDRGTSTGNDGGGGGGGSGGAVWLRSYAVNISGRVEAVAGKGTAQFGGSFRGGNGGDGGDGRIRIDGVLNRTGTVSPAPGYTQPVVGYLLGGVAQSLGYDTGLDAPVFKGFEVNNTLNGGWVNLSFSDSPDNLTWSGWVTNVTLLAQRYIRWQAVLNGTGAATPVLDRVVIRYTAPSHPPRFVDYLPKSDPTISENESQTFSAVTADDYGFPTVHRWSLDGRMVKETWSDRSDYTYQTDYSSSGWHNVSVAVDNLVQSIMKSWRVKVNNVNRPPAIVSYEPPTLTPGIAEGERQTFRITASDPDMLTDTPPPTLTYQWYRKGPSDPSEVRLNGAVSTEYTFNSTYSSAGTYAFRVAVSDGAAVTDLKWALGVTNTPATPVIIGFAPADDPVISETEWVTFNVTADAKNGLPLTYLWLLDGVPAGSVSPAFTYTTDYGSAGVHEVSVAVANGEMNASRKWTCTVKNVNRLPAPVISSPRESDSFPDGVEVDLNSSGSADPDGENLTFRWFEGTRLLGKGAALVATFPAGAHRVRLEASDVSGGNASVWVNISVKTADMTIEGKTDPSAPRPGQTVRFTATVRNRGSFDITGLPVRFSVDGAQAGERVVDVIPAGGEVGVVFEWNATAGEHHLEARAGSAGWNRTVAVQKGSVKVVSGQTTPWPLYLLAVLIVGAAVAGAYIYMRTRKGASPHAPAPPPPAQAAPPPPPPPAPPAPQYPAYPEQPAYYPPPPAYPQAPPPYPHAQPYQVEAYPVPTPEAPPAPAQPVEDEKPKGGKLPEGVDPKKIKTAKPHSEPIDENISGVYMQYEKTEAQDTIQMVRSKIVAFKRAGHDMSEPEHLIERASHFYTSGELKKAKQFATKAKNLATEIVERAKAEAARKL